MMEKQLMPIVFILLISLFYSCEKEDNNNTNITVTDYDGNVYKTVEIGNQIWMAENLKTTHYSDGTLIPLIEDGAIWDDLGNSDKAMCYYTNSVTNKDIYGALYTWAAAMNGASSSNTNPSDVQGICPVAWHLPSDEEWKELEMYLDMSQVDADMPGFRGTNEGSKLAGNSNLWNNETLENDMAFGTSGFMALPAGYMYHNGSYSHLGIGTNFWSTTMSGDTLAWNRFLFCYNSEVYRFTNKLNNGFSVRCIKD